jgi:hypothetical protein
VSLLRRLVEAEAGEDRARPGRRRMGADLGEPGLDLGDPVRLPGGLGLAQQGGALAVRGQHRRARREVAARCFLGDPADPRATA